MTNAQKIAAERPNRCPTHPGILLRETVSPALRLSVTEAASQLRIARQTLHRILAGQIAVTPEMAVRLGKFCGNRSGIWLRLQQAHHLWKAEAALKEELKHIPSHAA